LRGVVVNWECGLGKLEGGQILVDEVDRVDL
jgi:hypothetical protein